MEKYNAKNIFQFSENCISNLQYINIYINGAKSQAAVLLQSGLITSNLLQSARQRGLTRQLMPSYILKTVLTSNRVIKNNCQKHDYKAISVS